MTRDEFFTHRARMDFERNHGITRCPDGAAAGATPAGPVPMRLGKTAKRHRRAGRVAARFVMHQRDESGEAIPMRGVPMRGKH